MTVPSKPSWKLRRREAMDRMVSASEEAGMYDLATSLHCECGATWGVDITDWERHDCPE